MTRFSVLLFAIFFTLNGWAAPNTITLKVNGTPVVAEIANTPAQRNKGLMGRENLKHNHGMLFVFAADDYYAMWMKDTPSPLSVAFIDVNGKILNVAEMLPFTEESHFAAGPSRYALEMSAGWFSKHKILPGAKIEGLAKAPQAKE